MQARLSIAPAGEAIVGVTVVSFSASPAASSSASYAWDFGDGRRGSGPAVEHVYEMTGDFLVVLTVSDGSSSSSDSGSVRVRSLSGYWEARDEGVPAGFGFQFRLSQRGSVLAGAIDRPSLCPGRWPPSTPGTIAGQVTNPRALTWTLDCVGTSSWIGEAAPSLDALYMRRTNAPATAPARVYYRVP